MVVQARADLIYAVIGYVRSFTAEWSALQLNSAAGWKGGGSGLRISGERQGGKDGWDMPTRAIRIRKAGGPNVADDYTLGIKHTRIQATCYGATGAEADKVWAMLDAILVPAGDRAAGFVRSGCVVSDIVPESDAASLIDPDERWPYVEASYIATWVSRP